MRPIILLDLDGTLSDPVWRLPYILEQTPKDWKTFFSLCDKDPENGDMCSVVNGMFQGLKNTHDFYIFTTRPERVRMKCISWLTLHVSEEFAQEVILVMRPDNNYDNDVDLKRQWVVNLLKRNKKIALAVEDRLSIVNMYRDLGILTFHCAEGDY